MRWMLALAALLLMVRLGPAEAAVPGAICAVSTTGLGFGGYSPSLRRAADSSAMVTVTCVSTLACACTGGCTYALSASLGAGSQALRRLSNGRSNLSYQLYTDAAHSTVWGNSIGGTLMISGIIPYFCGRASRTATIWARIPGAQRASAGAYTDTIIVTLSY